MVIYDALSLYIYYIRLQGVFNFITGGNDMANEMNKTDARHKVVLEE